MTAQSILMQFFLTCLVYDVFKLTEWKWTVRYWVSDWYFSQYELWGISKLLGLDCSLFFLFLMTIYYTNHFLRDKIAFIVDFFLKIRLNCICFALVSWLCQTVRDNFVYSVDVLHVVMVKTMIFTQEMIWIKHWIFEIGIFLITESKIFFFTV